MYSLGRVGLDDDNELNQKLSSFKKRGSRKRETLEILHSCDSISVSQLTKDLLDGARIKVMELKLKL